MRIENGESLDMTITSIGVHVLGEDDEWRIFHYL